MVKVFDLAVRTLKQILNVYITCLTLLSLSLWLLNDTLSFYLCRAYPPVVGYILCNFQVCFSDIENAHDNALKGKTFLLSVTFCHCININFFYFLLLPSSFRYQQRKKICSLFKSVFKDKYIYNLISNP